MARYYATSKRSRFAKTHVLTGHGEEYVTTCGIKFIRQTRAFKELVRIRVHPVGRTTGGLSVWAFPLATCSVCKAKEPPPFWKSHFPSEKEKETSGPEGVRRGQQGGMDVDLHGGGHDSSEYGPRRLHPPEGWGR